MYSRHLSDNLLSSLQDTPIVVLQGLRQAGKTTLARALRGRGHDATYVTFDDATSLAAARSDPAGFLAAQQGPLILDEIQRAPELVLPIKADVDHNRRPGRFLLTGSSSVMQLPRLADAFVGRMEIHTLLPLSQGEIEGTREGFIDAVFADELPRWSKATFRAAGALSKSDLGNRILTGGYPEVLARRGTKQRQRWFESYLSTVMMRDVRDLANIEGLVDLPRLLVAVAGRAGGLVNYAELGRDVGLHQVTVKRYLALLAATFLLQPVMPWFTNRVKRVVKSPKLYFTDTGLLAHVLGATPDAFAAGGRIAGTLLENFVAGELNKQLGWSEIDPTLWHFRDHRGHDVDFVLESRGGRQIVGIEVKATATLDADDFRGLRLLAEAAGERFHRGVVLYTGAESVPFGERLHALPVTAVWTLGSRSLR
ncbi:MAG: ATP-binding protein [Phycisphaerales bacterium]|nr:MAG: ATP-binding protein [Phycisphaerales bacterium]